MRLRERSLAPNSKGSRARGASEQDQSVAAARELLVSLENATWGRDWKGKAGLTDRSVYMALMRKAWHHGTLIPSGVKVSVALRPLAIEAGMSKPTLLAAIKRLTQSDELIRRDGRGRGPESGAFVLLTHPRSAYPLAQRYLRTSSVSLQTPEWVSSARLPFRWGPGRLGKFKEFLLDALRRFGDPTKRELAVAMGRRPRDLRPHLNALVELGALERRDDRFALHKDAFYDLWMERQNNGEIEAEERDRRRYKEESDAFREKWARGEVRRKRKRRADNER